jgi:hypothetical protein
LNNDNPLLRVLAVVAPILIIAVVAGAIGYATTKPKVAPIPPLPDAPPAQAAAQGQITDVSADHVTLVTDAGATLDYAIAPDATVEALKPISLAMLQPGDWINGGAIPHPDTILALVSLIYLPDPVTP